MSITSDFPILDSRYAKVRRLERRLRGRFVDENSIIYGDISQPIWTNQYEGNSAWRAVPQLNYETISTGFLDGILLTGQGTSSAGAWTSYVVLIPPGVTSISLSCVAKTTSGTGTLGLAINTTLGSGAGFTGYTATTTAQTFTKTAAVTAGSKYYIEVETENASKTVMVTRPTVTVTGGTGIFSAPFTRLQVHPSLVWGNGEVGLIIKNSVAIASKLSGRSQVRFGTNASSFVIEHVFSGASIAETMSVIVNGEPYQEITSNTSTTPETFGYTTVTLPSGYNEVEVWASRGQDQYSVWFVPRAMYFSQSAQVDLRIPDPRRALLIGDSIFAGGDDTAVFPYGGVSGSFRTRYPGGEVINTTMPGLRLNDIASNAATLAAFVARNCSRDVADIVIAIGVNDYAQNITSAATFETNYAALLDALKLRAPGARMWCVQPIPRTQTGSPSGEAANSFGSTLPDFRTAITNAVSSRSTWATVIAGGTIMTSSDLSADGIHLLKNRQAKYAQGILSAMGLIA